MNEYFAPLIKEKYVEKNKCNTFRKSRGEKYYRK